MLDHSSGPPAPFPTSEHGTLVNTADQFWKNSVFMELLLAPDITLGFSSGTDGDPYRGALPRSTAWHTKDATRGPLALNFQLHFLRNCLSCKGKEA